MGTYRQLSALFIFLFFLWGAIASHSRSAKPWPPSISAARRPRLVVKISVGWRISVRGATVWRGEPEELAECAPHYRALCGQNAAAIGWNGLQRPCPAGVANRSSIRLDVRSRRADFDLESTCYQNRVGFRLEVKSVASAIVVRARLRVAPCADRNEPSFWLGVMALGPCVVSA